MTTNNIFSRLSDAIFDFFTKNILDYIYKSAVLTQYIALTRLDKGKCQWYHYMRL